MPIEALISDGMPQPFARCPKCTTPFRAFMRGQVTRFSWWGLRKRIWCVICGACKCVVGYEEIPRPIQQPQGSRCNCPYRDKGVHELRCSLVGCWCGRKPNEPHTHGGPSQPQGSR